MQFRKSIFLGNPALTDTVFAWNARAKGLNQTTIARRDRPLPKGFKASAPAYLLETEPGISILCKLMVDDDVDRLHAIGILDVAMTFLAREMGPEAKAAVVQYIVSLQAETPKA